MHKANRKEQRAYDREACTWRHRIENFFASGKEYRGSATRYDNTASSAARHLAPGGTAPPFSLHTSWPLAPARFLLQH